MSEDPVRDAWRYRIERMERDEAIARGEAPEETGEADPERAQPATTAAQAAYVEIAIQQAIRRGDFDDLPGAGKPLEGLTGTHDPDWWIRRKIEREQLGGLGPPALTLRVENAELDDRLDRMHREDDVRAAIEEFNARVVEARRQLLGGPPVVTPTRQVDDEVRAWHERREAKRRQAEAERAASQDEERPTRRRWQGRRTQD